MYYKLTHTRVMSNITLLFAGHCGDIAGTLEFVISPSPPTECCVFGTVGSSVTDCSPWTCVGFPASYVREGLWKIQRIPKRLELSKIPPPTSLFPLDLYLCEGGSRIGLTLGWCPCFQDGAGHPGINKGQWHGSTPIRPEAFLSTVWKQYFCLFSACRNHASVHPAHMQPKPPARIWGGLT